MAINQRFFCLCFCFVFVSCLFAQVRENKDYELYINQYKDLAVKQMHKHRIPASITLAQALLESGAGKGDLAQRSNNHFGIKRGSDWTGPTVTHDDDRRGEHFRLYDSVEQSYEDHSLFLHRARYQRLFRLDMLDYQGWARGLKACGYATNPVYADRLIRIIELYELMKYDEDIPTIVGGLTAAERGRTTRTNKQDDYPVFRVHHITTNNGVLCIVAKDNDSWESLSKELNISKRKLLKLNEAVETVDIHPGEFIYLQKKSTKGPKEMKGKWHKIEKGESMYSIAQKYGIRLQNLYDMNYREADYYPATGDLLKVR